MFCVVLKAVDSRATQFLVELRDDTVPATPTGEAWHLYDPDWAAPEGRCLFHHPKLRDGIWYVPRQCQSIDLRVADSALSGISSDHMATLR